jgi:hypothetical protein
MRERKGRNVPETKVSATPDNQRLKLSVYYLCIP